MKNQWIDPATGITYHIENGKLFTYQFGSPVPTDPDGHDGVAVLSEASRLAEENQALKAESEEYQLFGGELVGRLGLDREEMEGKPDSVGNQILAILDERMARLTALEEENRRLLEEMDSPAHIRSLATPETLEGMAQDYPFAAGLLTAAADMIRARR